MKNRNIGMKLMTLVLLVSSSCSDFLNEEPQTAFTQEEVFADLDKIEPLILGMYTNWRNTKKDRHGFMFMLGTDESQQGTQQVTSDADQGGLDKYDGFLAPSNKSLEHQWEIRWPIISTASSAIYALKVNQQDPTRRDILLGDASFIRAALSFEAAQYWGEIPVVDVDKLNEYGTGRQSLPVVYAAIINDLQVAIEHLPATQEDKRRATKTAAQALLGKVYLYAQEESGVRDFGKAKEQFEAVISSGQHSLVANYADLWDASKPNPSESIYSFQFAPYPDHNQIQWQMGTRSVTNAKPYCYFGGYDLMMPTMYGYKMVTDGGVWEDGDLRKDESIRFNFQYEGVDYPPVLYPDELDPHVKKYEDIRGDKTYSFYYSGKNVFYLRFSDILLCYAETLNETGNTGAAVTEVNKVRARAWGGTLPPDKEWSTGLSQSEFRTKILDERMRELCFEGWRRMDLNRYGKLVELVSARNHWAAESGTIDAHHSRYPIPRQEIINNPDIEPEDQNPGYTNQ